MSGCVHLNVFVTLQETFGKILAIEKYQDRLRAKGLLTKDIKQM